MRILAEARLDSPVASRRGLWATCGEMFGFFNGHRWNHIGKITSLRALLG